MHVSKVVYFSLRVWCACFLLTGAVFAQEHSGTDGVEYLIRPSDVLSIEVFQEPDLSRQIRVQGDGTIILPLIGKLKVADMSVGDAQARIEELYNADYLVNPQVHLLVLEYAPRRVQVLGQVNRPGFVPIPPEEELTLTQAISGANGFNLRANRTNVQIRREEEGHTRVINVNVKEILRNPEAKDLLLKDGDTVFVDESMI